MTYPDGQGPAEFQPVKVGPRRRRIDPVVIGVAVVALALVLAVLKPWDGGVGGVAVAPTASPSDLAGSPSPSTSAPIALGLPIWADVVQVVSQRTDWGIRTIVLGAPSDATSPAPSEPYAERWFPVGDDGGLDDTAIVDEPEGSIIALGLTFPQTETPLDVRIWLVHEGGELEWMDVRPINDVPARGAYLFLRRAVAGAAVRPWDPGRYRMDVLVGGGIRRIAVLILDPSGELPDPDPWPLEVPPATPFDADRLAGIPTGLFIQTDDFIATVPVAPGPPLDETAAWLDLDTSARAAAPESFVARLYEPGIIQVGVALPAYSTVRDADVRRLAPFDDPTGIVRWTNIGSLSAVSYVAFGPAGGVTWRPGAYAITVSWEDTVGPHEGTWHIELRPGPLPATPLLLSATRSWATYAGMSGVLLGVTEPLSGTDPLGISLVDIIPQTVPGYPGLSGDDLIGCGKTHVQGRPEVIGIVGSTDLPLAPVAARILYPFDEGPLEVLTASGSVPGLTLITPTLTAEFGGPASYGIRAGTEQDAPGVTICVGLPAAG